MKNDSWSEKRRAQRTEPEEYQHLGDSRSTRARERTEKEGQEATRNMKASGGPYFKEDPKGQRLGPKMAMRRTKTLEVVPGDHKKHNF